MATLWPAEDEPVSRARRAMEDLEADLGRMPTFTEVCQLVKLREELDAHDTIDAF